MLRKINKSIVHDTGIILESRKVYLCRTIGAYETIISPLTYLPIEIVGPEYLKDLSYSIGGIDRYLEALYQVAKSKIGCQRPKLTATFPHSNLGEYQPIKSRD